MKNLLLIPLLVSYFTGCGKSKEKKNIEINQQSLDLNSQDNSKTQKPKIVIADIIKPKKTLTIYVHGFSKSGVNRDGVFGNDSYDKVIDKMVEFTGFDTTKNYDKENFKNLIAIAPYYGNTPPRYYTQEDKDEVANKEGIPRYALITAKFAKEMIKRSGADSLNIVSASMGSLISRYIIEKNLENLAGDKKIKKWLSLEGVIAGNIGASNKHLLDIVNTFDKQPIDVDHMKYSWIEKTFATAHKSTSPYMKDISIAFESSTKDDLNSHLISYITKEANDGYQAVKDTYFEGYPHTYFHENHTGLEDSLAAWGYASTFLTSSKRVKITLLEATLEDLHEDKLFYGSILPAEIAFESKVYSAKAEQKWKFTGAIDERLFRGY